MAVRPDAARPALDNATSEIYSAFLVEQEGTASTFRALKEVFAAKGLPGALYTDRGSHYFHAPAAGGKVNKDRRTQVGQVLHQLGIEHIAAYSPEARGRSERAFGTLQDRLFKERDLAGITTFEAANRFIEDTYLPDHNRRFAMPPELEDSAFLSLLRPEKIDDILCLHAQRIVGRDNTVRYGKRILQLPAGPDRPTTSRHMSGSTSIPTAPSRCSTNRDASPDTAAMETRSTLTPGRPRDPLRRDRPAYCGEVVRRGAAVHFPTGPATSTEAAN